MSLSGGVGGVDKSHPGGRDFFFFPLIFFPSPVSVKVIEGRRAEDLCVLLLPPLYP